MVFIIPEETFIVVTRDSTERPVDFCQNCEKKSKGALGRLLLLGKALHCFGEDSNDGFLFCGGKVVKIRIRPGTIQCRSQLREYALLQGRWQSHKGRAVDHVAAAMLEEARAQVEFAE